MRRVVCLLGAALPLALFACGSDQVSPIDGGGFADQFTGVDSPSGNDGGHGDSGKAHDASHPRDATSSPEGATSPDAGDGSVDSGFDASLPTTCSETFSLPNNGYTTVVLQTDYDSWTTPIPMTLSAGTWQVVTPVPYTASAPRLEHAQHRHVIYLVTPSTAVSYICLVTPSTATSPFI